MADMIANRTMTVLGQEYRAGDSIPEAAIRRLPSQRLKQLLDQRRVSESQIVVARGPGRPRKEG